MQKITWQKWQKWQKIQIYAIYATFARANFYKKKLNSEDRCKQLF